MSVENVSYRTPSRGTTHRPAPAAGAANPHERRRLRHFTHSGTGDGRKRRAAHRRMRSLSDDATPRRAAPSGARPAPSAGPPRPARHVTRQRRGLARRWRAGEGNRKGLAAADKAAECGGEALLGAVARAGLEGPPIKGWQWARFRSCWPRAIRAGEEPRWVRALASFLVCVVIFGWWSGVA